MMKKYTAVLIILFSIYSCATSDTSNTQQSESSKEVVDGLHPKESAIIWQQTSAEYEALCLQAYNSALMYLNTFAVDQAGNGKEKAIVMDLDETVLDNSAYNAQLIMDGETFSKKSWFKWVARVEAGLVPGAKEFIDQMENYNIKVLFVSNRSYELQDHTIENLRIYGINVENDQLFLKQGDNSKSGRRSDILNDYEVLMYIGDNLADFNDMFEAEMNVTERKSALREYAEEFGKKFIILPNPVYGKWESTLEISDPAYPYNKNYKGDRAYLRGYKSAN